jgi:hypothetical protein
MPRRRHRVEPTPASAILELLEAWSRQPVSAQTHVLVELRTAAAALHKAAGEVVELPTPPADLNEGARAQALALDVAAELLAASVAGLPLQVAELERLAIVEALRRSKSHAALAARLLGVGRSTLYRRLGREAHLRSEAAARAPDQALRPELAIHTDDHAPAVVVFGHRLGQTEAQGVADAIYVALGRLAGRESAPDEASRGVAGEECHP